MLQISNKNHSPKNKNLQNALSNNKTIKKDSPSIPCHISNKIFLDDTKLSLNGTNHFSINDIKLNYIDDEEISQANEVKTDSDIFGTRVHPKTESEVLIEEDEADDVEEDDDYDDNVIYEGESDEINDEYSSHDEEPCRVNNFLFISLSLRS